MNLEEFVKQSLMSITNGVASAQKESQLSIAPSKVSGKDRNQSQLINFEVAVTTSGEAGGGIQIFSIGKIGAGASTEAVNRIKFNVPVFFQIDSKNGED